MPDKFLSQFDHFPNLVWNGLLIGVALVIGLFLKFMLSLLLRKPPPGKKGWSLTRTLLAMLGKPVSYFLPLLALNFLLPMMKMEAFFYPIVNKFVEILLILSFANLLIAIVKVLEDYVYHTYDIEKADNLKERKIRTQLQFIRRMAISLILVLTVCVILLSFNNLRKIGAGLLTGVGVGGIIIGFAAQRSLGNLLAGFQIAFTQPIRIDDVLVVEGEWGRVEEITLTYVVVKIWDQRRLVLPINYFIEKPFQNWTRNTADIMGTVFLYLDYNAPLDELREELTRLLSHDPLWDKRVNILQVTNTSEKTIEIRALMSARSSGDAFDLRCNVREGLIKFVRQKYPDSFPLVRASLEKDPHTASAINGPISAANTSGSTNNANATAIVAGDNKPGINV